VLKNAQPILDERRAAQSVERLIDRGKIQLIRPKSVEWKPAHNVDARFELRRRHDDPSS
jgi:hypothetical protein